MNLGQLINPDTRRIDVDRIYQPQVAPPGYVREQKAMVPRGLVERFVPPSLEGQTKASRSFADHRRYPTRPKEKSTAGRALAFVEGHPGCKLQDIRRGLGPMDCGASALSVVINRLKAAGHVRHEGERANYSYFATGKP